MINKLPWGLGAVLAMASFTALAKGVQTSQGRIIDCKVLDGTICRARIKDAVINDTVHILNANGSMKANGKITDLKRGVATISIEEDRRELRKNFTRKDRVAVIMKDRNSNLSWSAAFSKDE